MKDDISDIQSHYDDNVGNEEERLKRHQLEYDLTWRYLTRYLPPTGSILEIGAGPGTYTLPLCRRGYAVTAVDLSATLLERCQQRLAEAAPRCVCVSGADDDIASKVETASGVEVVFEASWKRVSNGPSAPVNVSCQHKMWNVLQTSSHQEIPSTNT